MPKVRRTPPPPHVVVVDTNILWDKDKKLAVCLAFDDFWRRNSPLIPMTLSVPDVVFGELHFQQATSALKALSSITETFSELAGITSSTYSHKCNESTIKSQVRAKLEKWLKAHAGTLVPTPVASVDWTSVVDAAIWRKPPFTFDPREKNNEKGFRDALILETVVHICDTVSVGTTVIFVCNDYLLRTTAESRLKSSKKLLAFESLIDFEAYIKLTQQQFTSAFVKSIQNHARAKFFAKGDTNCIYSKNQLFVKIPAEFAADLALQSTSTNALSVLAQSTVSDSAKMTQQRIWIRSTQFSKLAGTREFHWTSRIDIARLYEIERTQGLLASAMPPLQLIQVVGFDVRWKSNVKTDGRFHDIELIGIDKKETQLYDSTEENRKELRFV